MSDNVYWLIFTLFVTVAFSFVPEQWLKPATPKLNNRAVIVQALLVTILFLIVSLIVQRLVFASLAVSIFLLILTAVSNAKFQALREPLVFSDIAMFSQAFKHPRLYFPFLGFWPVVIMPLMIVSLIYALFYIEPAMPFTGRRILLSLLVIVICFILAKKLATEFQLNQDPAEDNATFGLLNSLFAYQLQSRSKQHQDYIVNALSKSPFLVKTPINNTEKTPPSFFDVSSKQPPPKLHAPAHTSHNITVIQSESFFDARRLSESIKRDVLKHFDACLNESIQHGKLDVPAWGANTMRTEFSFLTGLKYEDMGLYRYYPYQYLHKMPIVSLAKLLQAQGYYCVCIHPHPASFFGRDRIFPKMGFDAFIDINDFDKKHTFGPYISDQAVTEKILQTSHLHAQKHKDKPLFIFAITMENHGPLHLEKTTNDERKQYYSTEPLDDSNDLTVYLRHLNNADKMIADLTTAFKQQDQAHTLCFYGDHIPSMPKIYDALCYEDKHSDYFIWNNLQTKIANTAKTPNSDTQSLTAVTAKTPESKTIKVDSLAETLLKYAGLN